MVMVVRQEGRTKAVVHNEVKAVVLSAFLELRFRDGIMPIQLLRSHVLSEIPSLLPQVLRQMEEEGLIKLVQGEGYEPGARLTLRAAMPLVEGVWPWEKEGGE